MRRVYDTPGVFLGRGLTASLVENKGLGRSGIHLVKCCKSWVILTNHDQPVREGFYRDLTKEDLMTSGVTVVQ